MFYQVVHRWIITLLPVLASVLLAFFGAFVLHIIEEPEEIRVNRNEKTDLTIQDTLLWNFWGSLSFVVSVYTTIGKFTIIVCLLLNQSRFSCL